MRYRESNWSALGIKVKAAPESVYRDIRDAMLQELGEFSPVNHFLLDMEITFAAGINELWDLRVNLLEVLRIRHGDRVAMQHMQAITQKFVGYHPDAKK